MDILEKLNIQEAVGNMDDQTKKAFLVELIKAVATTTLEAAIYEALPISTVRSLANWLGDE